MTEIYHPVLSKRKILRSLVIALFIGGLLLVVAVLPAEYGIDPIGAGKLFGFNKLYTGNNKETQIRMTYPQLKLEKAGSAPHIEVPSEAGNPAPDQQYETRSDSVQVTVPAGKGIEYKVYMLKYGQLKYDWTTGNEIVYVDFHGEVAEEKPSKETYYQSYTLAYSDNMAGTMLSPFEGKHGWFFRNNSKQDIVITLRLQGQYSL